MFQNEWDAFTRFNIFLFCFPQTTYETTLKQRNMGTILVQGCFCWEKIKMHFLSLEFHITRNMHTSITPVRVMIY